jgi:hypothetical protein
MSLLAQSGIEQMREPDTGFLQLLAAPSSSSQAQRCAWLS